MSEPAPRITFVYDDDTQKLLQQYQQQLEDYEEIFDMYNHGLTSYEYSRRRELDPVLMTILEVISRIYETAIPIRILIGDDTLTPTGATH